VDQPAKLKSANIKTFPYFEHVKAIGCDIFAITRSNHFYRIPILQLQGSFFFVQVNLSPMVGVQIQSYRNDALICSAPYNLLDRHLI
jgi:hypothetical protein